MSLSDKPLPVEPLPDLLGIISANDVEQVLTWFAFFSIFGTFS